MPRKIVVEKLCWAIPGEKKKTFFLKFDKKMSPITTITMIFQPRN